MTQYTAEQIWELRFNAAVERFGDYEKEMEIPVLEEKPVSLLLRSLEEKRFEMCKQRYSYQGMEEYMEIPDMQVWLKLKNEIIDFPKTTLKSPFEYYGMEEDEDDEFRYKCFKDKWLSRRRNDSF